MRSSIKRLRIILAGIGLLLAMLPPKFAAAQSYYGSGGNNNSYQQFYDQLAPYGQWIDDSQYGYVWQPDAGQDFRPYYTNGYWVNTEYGNTWVSDYEWGWAPFHYGRWTNDPYYGWLWIPGQDWGPAWVNWRNGGGYYGWAPLGPGVSVDVSFGGGWYAPDNWWVFTPQQYVLSHDFHRYSRPQYYNTSIIHNTTIINNTYVYNHNTYVTGPRRTELEHITGRPVQQYRINDAQNPRGGAQVRGNQVALFRPNIAQGGATGRPQRIAEAQQPIRATGVSPTGFRAPVHQNINGNPNGVIPRNNIRPTVAAPQNEGQPLHTFSQEPQRQQVAQPTQPVRQPVQQFNAQPRNDRTFNQPQQQAQPVRQPQQMPDRQRGFQEQPRQNVMPSQPRPVQQNQPPVQQRPAMQPRMMPQPQSRPAPQPERQGAPARQPEGRR